MRVRVRVRVCVCVCHPLIAKRNLLPLLLFSFLRFSFKSQGAVSFYHPLPNEDGGRKAVKQSGTPDFVPACIVMQSTELQTGQDLREFEQVLP